MALATTPNAALSGADPLRGRSSGDPKAAVREAAKQFEALFMQEVMKSMRQASATSGLLDNAGTQLGTELLDTQFANQMTGLKGGLGEAIARQLERQMGTAATLPLPAAKPTAALMPSAAAGAPASTVQGATAGNGARQLAFMDRNAAAAKAAEADTGIPAAFLLGQAAHESGWGGREIKNADGTSAHNLFGIKAGGSWQGATTDITTTEYIGGVARKLTQKFRAYASAEESFRDYAKLMKESPRYAGVLANASNAEGFARGLQKAGYATDPAYAEKLSRVINTTLRLQQATQQQAAAVPPRTA